MLIQNHLSEPNQPTFASLWQSGFGTIAPNSLIVSTQGLSLFSNVLIANTPQLVVSLIYLSYNNLLTSLFLSQEFTKFSQKRSALRVTTPQGQQKSTFWLSLPYRASLPLLISSMILHWSLSQTIFLAEIEVVSLDGGGSLDMGDSVNSVGWSALGFLVLLLVSGLMILVIVVLGFLRHPPGVPIVQSCSLAISAACHPCRSGEAQTALKYGVLKVDHRGNEYVGLSSGPVLPLSDGHDYA